MTGREPKVTSCPSQSSHSSHSFSTCPANFFRSLLVRPWLLCAIPIRRRAAANREAKRAAALVPPGITVFCSTGTPAVFLHPSEAQHGDLGILQPSDLLLLLSNSGKTREIVELVTLARNLNPQIPIIVITGKKDSPLAAEADVVLCTGDSPEVCPLGLTPTTSTTMMTVIGDVLVVGAMKEIGFTVEQYALRHHGGYLGATAKAAARTGKK